VATSETKLKIVVDAENRTASALNSIKNQLDVTQVSVAGISDAMKTVGKVGVGALTALGGFLGWSVKTYGETQLSVAKVDATLKAMGGTALEARDKIMEASKAVVRLGFDDDAAAVSITKLYQRTGDLNQALELNALAMDLARAKSISLESASQMISLVMSGNARALREYGIVLDETSTPMEALAELQTMVAGQAEAATSSIIVQQQMLSEQFTNLRDSVGALLIPMLLELVERVSPVIDKIKEWIDTNPELAKTVLIATAAVLGIVAVMLPLGIILPTLVTGFMAIAGAIGIAGGIIAGITLPAWGLIAVLGVIGYTVYRIANQWQDAWDLIVISVGASANVIQNIIESVANFVIDNLNMVINGINNVIASLSKIPKLGKQFEKMQISTLERVAFERYDTGAIYNRMMDRPSGGGTVVNINGGTYLSEDVAEDIGDLIMERLKLSNAL